MDAGRLGFSCLNCAIRTFPLLDRLSEARNSRHTSNCSQFSATEAKLTIPEDG